MQSWKLIFLTPPLHFLCGGRLPGEMNKNNHIKVRRCSVAMVTAIDHASPCIFYQKHSVSFSGAWKLIQMKFHQRVEPPSWSIKCAINIPVFCFYIYKEKMVALQCCMSTILTNSKIKDNYFCNLQYNTNTVVC